MWRCRRYEGLINAKDVHYKLDDDELESVFKKMQNQEPTNYWI